MKSMGPVRWWISAGELREMRHLGWYERHGQTTRKPQAWFTADGLDPGQLVEAEVFRTPAIGEVTRVLPVPASICVDAGQLSAYLRTRGWTWSPQRPGSAATPAIAARTALNVSFWMESAGLLVEFENFPILDAATGQWNASPRWPGFLLACGAPMRLYQEAGGWDRCIDVLKYVADHLPRMRAEALTHLAQAKSQKEKERLAAQHEWTLYIQSKLKKISKRKRHPGIRPTGNAQNIAADTRTPPDRSGKPGGTDKENPGDQHGEG